MNLVSPICLHKLLGKLDGIFLVTSEVFLALTALLFVVGLIKSAWFAFRSLVSTVKLMSLLPANSQRTRIASLTSQSSDKGYVYVFKGNLSPLAFSIGFFKPRIYISSRLVSQLDSSKLGIVIHHEIGHQSRRDPLKSFLLSTLAELLWFIPWFTACAKRFRLRSEIACDKRASEKGYSQFDIARTLLDVASGSALVPFSLTLSSIDDLLEQRVKILMGEEQRKFMRISSIALVTSAIVFMLFITSGFGLWLGKYDPGGLNTKIITLADSCAQKHMENIDHKIFGLSCPHCTGEMTQDAKLPSKN